MEEAQPVEQPALRDSRFYTDPAWIIQNFNLTDAEVINIYQYGSHVYGTASASSDWDYIVILKNGPSPEDTIQGKMAGADATVMSEERFVHLLAQHAPQVLECLFLPSNNVILQRKQFDWTLDVQQLRKAVSAKVGHSWSKAQKKFTVAKEVYIAKKSLFHSFRILAYGIQLASHGRIVDYTVMNGLWEEIKANPSEEWDVYRDLYKKRWNALKSEFRNTAPKEVHS